jgi:HSP20 family protein
MGITNNKNYDKYNDNNRDILPIDSLFNRFFNLGRMQRGSSLPDTTGIFRDIDKIHKEMSRMFDLFNEISLTNPPKELTREYETQEDGKVREVDPIVYGYSMTIGPDGKPHVREFGNVKSVANLSQSIGKPSISDERESLYDITTTDKEVKIVLEMPGLQEEDVKINAYESKVEIKTANRSPRKYHKVVDLPKDADTKTTRFTYNNGILEVTFDKKRDIKTKGKDAYVHLRNIFSNIYRIILESKRKILKFTKRI